MIDREELLRTWLLGNCREDATWAVRASELRAAFEEDCCGDGGIATYDSGPDRWSISPRMFAVVVQRVFPNVTLGKANAGRAFLGLARRPTADCPPAPFPMKIEDRRDYFKY